MKFVFSLLLLSFLSNLSLAFSHDDGAPIFDTNYWAIYPEARYYIVPSFFGFRSGKLKLAKTGHSNCPVTVLEQDFTTDKGVPVQFSIIGSSYDILTGTPIFIEFTKKPDCVKSSKWLIFVDNVIKKSCVGIGGPENYPGMKILNGTFNIQKLSGITYKFVFCDSGSKTFSDIGWYDNGEGEGRLVLADKNISGYAFVEDVWV
ncbi:kunitz-type trypsin inhibitor-like 2 protein [Vicia villosa]|uniref:kunitz-type trypsin inhibitor-like 2 protein n=1 Tax=Vicia villosa TaxID=3911 RepID=UPI00273AB13E|nr:kunitz-type trypsin inhibitor-like 2 protein [Vicia villosa]